MKYNFKVIKIEDIKVGDRFRVEYGDIEDLAADIEVNGLYHPVVLAKDMSLLAGGRRLAAFKHLKRDSIPAHILPIEDALQEREVELLENVMRKELTWVERAKLVREIDKLYRDKNPKWSTDKTAEILDRAGSTVRVQIQLAEAMDKIPELAKCKTEDEARRVFNSLVEDLALQELASRGQADQPLQPETEGSPTPSPRGELTKSQLMSMRAYDHYRVCDVFDGFKHLSDGSIHFIECDGPYAVDLHDQKQLHVHKAKWEQYEEIERSEYPAFCEHLCAELYRVAADNTWTLFWYGQEHYQTVIKALLLAGFAIDPIPALWLKPSGQTMQPQKYLARAYETFIVAAKGTPVLQKPGRLNHFSFTPIASMEKFHPTQKPIELYEELYATFCFPPPPKGPDWLILSPFAGSGSALLTAQKLGYRVLGFDMVQEYKDKYMVWVKTYWGRRML